jgi:branched-chain amino acid transport system permease protein
MTTVFPRTLRENSPLHIGLRLARAAAVVVLIPLLPYLVPSFRLSQITAACIFAIAIAGNNVLSGFGGQFSLGHAAFFGIGAYTTGILTLNHGVSAPLAIVCGIGISFAVGVVVGVPALRVQGTYLALVTLAFGVLFPSVVRRFASLTGGSGGLLGLGWKAPSTPYFSGPNGQTLWMYWVVMVSLVLSSLVVWNLMRSRTGRAIVALRDNEKPAIIMGINRTFVRTVLFGVSAGIAGLAGGLFALNTGLLTPDSFSLLLSINFIVGMILGGSASYWGPVLGGLAIYFIPTWTSSITAGPISGVLFGVVLIAFVFVMRDGIVGLIKRVTALIVVVEPEIPKPGKRPAAPPGSVREPDPIPTDPDLPSAVHVGGSSPG